MQKTKVLLFAAIILCLFSLGNKAVFAVENDDVGGGNSEETVEEIVEAEEKIVENVATFEADEDSELKKMIAELQSELAEMKEGMSDLQTRVMESEMSQLRAQLLELQNNLLAGSSTEKSAAETIADLETDSKSEELENEIEFYDEDDLAAKLILAEAEIAKLKSKNDEEEDEKEEIIYEKIEEEIVAKTEIDEIDPVDVGEKMAKAGDAAAKIAKKKDDPKPASIIAKADGELLFQFPRSFSSQKMVGGAGTINAGNLVADILTTKNNSPTAPNFTRNSAPAEKIELFSAQNIAILAILIIAAMGIFIYFLIKNERKLLTSHSNIFPKNDFPLAKSAQKTLSPRNGSANKKIIK